MFYERKQKLPSKNPFDNLKFRKPRYVLEKQKLLVAVAGGIEPSTAEYALKMKADILIVGRYITSSKDVKNSMRQFINILPGYSDIDLKRIHVDDDDTNSLKSK